MSSLWLVAPLAIAALIGQASAQQIVLDDMDSSAVGSMENTHEGSFEPCLKDAYQGQYRHDWGKNKNAANLVFRFDPPKDGCYKIEEHHPGNCAQCARYMAHNAKIDVDYCRGMSKQFTVNQAVNGGQWNEIGWLPFYVGHEGRLKFRNHDKEQCDNEPCFWVADAVRVTWMGEKCHQTGVATVKVRPETDGDTKDLRTTLLDHQNVFKATMELQLNSDYVKVVGIVSAVGRRLLAASSTVFDVHFNAYRVPSSSSVASADLQLALQKAFSAAGAGVIVESASVKLDRPVGDNDIQNILEEGLGMNTTMFAIVAAVALLAAAGVAAICYRFATKKTVVDPTPSKQIDVVSVEENPVSAKVVELEEGKQEAIAEKKDDEESRSVSTDEGPGSDVHMSEVHSEEILPTDREHGSQSGEVHP